MIADYVSVSIPVTCLRFVELLLIRLDYGTRLPVLGE